MQKRTYIFVSLTVGALLGGSPASAQPVTAIAPRAHSPVARRVLVVIDNSGSMLRDDRIERARAASSRLIEALPVTGEVTLEIATASDRVLVLRTIVLRSPADRESARELVSNIQAIRTTTTSFRAIDGGIADVLQHDLQPAERAGLVFITDGLSDTPRNDLRPADLGTSTRVVGRGLYAVLAGEVPAAETFQVPTPTARSSRSPATPGRSGQSSCVLDLFSGNALSLEAPPSIGATLTQGFWAPFTGEAPTTSFQARVTNRSALPRTIRLDAVPPAGVAVSCSPSALTLRPGETGPVTVQLQMRAQRVEGASIRLHASTVDDNSTSADVSVQVETRPWMRSNGLPLALGGLLVAACLGGALAFLRRRLRVAASVAPDVTVDLPAGAWVPIESFLPNAPASGGGLGDIGRSFWGGLRARAGSLPLKVGGRMVVPGQQVSMRLTDEIEVSGQGFTLLRTDHAVAAPLMPDPFLVAPGGGDLAGASSGGLR